MEFFSVDSMVMCKRGMSIKHPTAGFDKELYIPPSDEFAFQSSVWDTQEELFGESYSSSGPLIEVGCPLRME